ncbi:saccharopine dehydrogenase NADP-binding domain-containing protein [bacterium]|nr:saccharopine dehydrogenase NADP-binding domain-containing protein [bacterium]
MKKVLVLGAGLVSHPLVEYLLNHNFEVTVASRTVSKAQALVKGHKNGQALSLNVKDDGQLDQLIKKNDLTISLLPYTFHVAVAKHCIEHKKHMVTTSYVSDAMRALDQDAKKAGVLLLNEIGVDPGIDHMSAMRIVDNVKNKNGKIVSFYSYCGGLPAPDCNDNPLGYKFSWSPRGVVMAGKNNAQYLKDGKVVKIPSKDLFAHNWILHVDELGDFEAYPNRDSLGYIDIYGLQGISTMYRGTLRNKGWCELLKAIVDLNLIDDDKRYNFSNYTFSKLFKEAAGLDVNLDVKVGIAKKLGISEKSEIISKIEWLGLLSDTKISHEDGSMMDILVDQLLVNMEYKKGERDMIVLHHNFVAERKDGKREKITSTLIDFGIPNGDSSMARTVSLPAAIAARMILENKITVTGVHIPVLADIYNPILDELETMKIVCKEKVYSL